MITKVKRLLGKKHKKSPKHSQKHIHPGVPTNTAAGPSGLQEELDIAPKGEKIVPIRIWTWTDSTVAPDEESGGGSRIVFQGKTNESQEPPAPETSTPGAVDVDDTDHGHGPSSECFRSLLPRLAFMWISMPFHTRGGRC